MTILSDCQITLFVVQERGEAPKEGEEETDYKLGSSKPNPDRKVLFESDLYEDEKGNVSISVSPVVLAALRLLSSDTNGLSLRLGQGMSYWTGKDSRKTQGYEFVYRDDVSTVPFLIVHNKAPCPNLQVKTKYYLIVAFPRHPHETPKNASVCLESTKNDAQILRDSLESGKIKCQDLFLGKEEAATLLKQAVDSSYHIRSQVTNLSIASRHIQSQREVNKINEQQKEKALLQNRMTKNPTMTIVNLVEEKAKHNMINNVSVNPQLKDNEIEVIAEDPGNSLSLTADVVALHPSSVHSSSVTAATMSTASVRCKEKLQNYQSYFTKFFNDPDLAKQFYAGTLPPNINDICARSSVMGHNVHKMFNNKGQLVPNWKDFIPPNMESFLRITANDLKETNHDQITPSSSYNTNPLQSNHQANVMSSHLSFNEQMAILEKQIELSRMRREERETEIRWIEAQDRRKLKRKKETEDDNDDDFNDFNDSTWRRG